MQFSVNSSAPISQHQSVVDNGKNLAQEGRGIIINQSGVEKSVAYKEIRAKEKQGSSIENNGQQQNFISIIFLTALFSSINFSKQSYDNRKKP